MRWIHTADLEFDASAVDALEESYRRGWVALDVQARDTLACTFRPITELPETLAHLTTIDSYTGRHDTAVWGARSVEVVTYLQTTDCVVEGAYPSDFFVALGGRSEQLARIVVDTAQLQRYRNVYLDPEMLTTTPEEFGHAFMVHAGIPWAAVVRVEIVEVPADPSAFAVPSHEFIPDAQVMRQWVRANRQRLQQFLTSLRHAA